MKGKPADTKRSRYRSLDDPDTLRGLVRRLGEGIYITSAEGELLDANKAFLAIFGFKTLAEAQNFRVEDLYMNPEQREKMKIQLGPDGEFRERELEIRRADGQSRTVLDTSYACKDDETGEVFYHGILVDIDSRKELERQLFEMSIRDPLTGCYNRRHLNELERDLESRDASWGCIYLDIDGFKQYNDQHGHAAGDVALIGLSRYLMRQVRAEDSVVRVGGDEFVAVLFDATAPQVEMVVKRLEKNAPGASPISFSLGWAVRTKREPLSRTIDRADYRLLTVRSGGRIETGRRRADTGQK